MSGKIQDLTGATFQPDNLIAGDFPLETESITVLAGLDLKRGTVLGKVTKSVPTTGTADGGNTGDGDMTTVEGRRDTKTGTYTATCNVAATDNGQFDVVNPDGNSLGTALVNSYSGTGNGAISGIQAQRDFDNSGYYSVKCIAAITNSGTFRVTNPSGTIIGEFTIPVSSSYGFVSDEINFTLADGVTDFVVDDEFLVAPFESDEISFVLNDGAADFVVGDIFTVAVTVGSNQCKPVDSSLSDGAEDPYCVLTEDIDTTATGSGEACVSVGYVSGTFNERSLIFGGADSADDHRDAMRALSMFIAPSTPAGPLDAVEA